MLPFPISRQSDHYLTNVRPQSMHRVGDPPITFSSSLHLLYLWHIRWSILSTPPSLFLFAPQGGAKGASLRIPFFGGTPHPASSSTMAPSSGSLLPSQRPSPRRTAHVERDHHPLFRSLSHHTYGIPANVF